MAAFSGAPEAPAPRAVAAAASSDRLRGEHKERNVPLAEAVESPPWAATTAQSDAATEFTIAQPVTLPSDGESHTLRIASLQLPATLERRTTPRTSPGVYLLATAARPAGVWPAGPLMSYQDGSLVGRVDWDPAAAAKFEIAMGRDDLMQVDIEAPGTFTQARGVFGGSVERRSTAVYAIANRHPTPVSVELLDAAPVSRNEAITVTHRYDPAPATTDWNKVTGIAAWKLDIAPQSTRRVSVTHVVTAPREAVVANLP